MEIISIYDWASSLLKNPRTINSNDTNTFESAVHELLLLSISSLNIADIPDVIKAINCLITLSARFFDKRFLSELREMSDSLIELELEAEDIYE